MGYSKRKLVQQMNEMGKRVKTPIQKIIQLMPLGFSDNDFVVEFKNCYRYHWEDLRQRHEQSKSNMRKLKSGKTCLFPDPYHFVLCKAFHNIRQARKLTVPHYTDEERKQFQKALMEDCEKKLVERNERKRKNKELLQNVSPDYADSLISMYFEMRRNHPEEVNKRYYVLTEIEKYNHRTFVRFLMNVVAKDRNQFCRELAHKALCRWGLYPTMHKKKKGKRCSGDNIKPQIAEDPTSLLYQIEQLQKEYEQSYSVFLSHRSSDRSQIIQIKDMLNKQGLNVYVDWVVDNVALEPTKYNEHTWPVLQQRLLQSKEFLYVHTINCKDSQWIPREIEYALQNGYELSILNLDESEEPTDYHFSKRYEIRDNAIVPVIEKESCE